MTLPLSKTSTHCNSPEQMDPTSILVASSNESPASVHFEDLQVIALDSDHVCSIGRLPEQLILPERDRDELWRLHPTEFPVIKIHGKEIPTPRWQQAYGADYHYSGQVNKALTVPAILAPLRAWAQEAIDPRLNGIFVNWYDCQLNHCIGAHRDSTKFMYRDAPIVMVSFGATRVMRLRKWKGKDRRDTTVSDGTVCILPFATNLAWTHEILRRKSDLGRRISVTFRAFDVGAVDATTNR